MDRDSRHARLWVKNPDRIDPILDVLPAHDPLSNDPEVLLVHELLHVSMDDMDVLVPGEIDFKNSPYELGQERHIINLSKALVLLDRRK